MKRKATPIERKASRGFDVEAYLEATGKARTVVTYRRREVVFSQGDPGSDIRYLQKGAIKLSVLSHIGKEAVVAMLAPGDFFGEGVLAGQSVRIGTATAVVASSVLIIEKESMVQLLHSEPDVLGPLHRLHAGAEHPHRGGPRRSALQLQRKAARPDAAAAGALRRAPIHSERCRRSPRRRSRR